MYRRVVNGFILPAYGPCASGARSSASTSPNSTMRCATGPTRRTVCWRLPPRCSTSPRKWELRAASNPCKFVRKYRETKRERFLTDEEFRRLGQVLNEMEAEGRLPVHPAAAFRLLGADRLPAQTRSWRSNGRTWTSRRARFGCRIRNPAHGFVPLSPAAARVRAQLPRIKGSPWVIPGRNPGQASCRPHSLLGPGCARRRTLRACASMTLRHTFASRGPGARRIAVDDRQAPRSQQDRIR